MTIYEELQPVASELLKEFKQGSIKLIQISSSGSSDAPTNTETSVDLDAVVRGLTYKYVKEGFSVQSDFIVSSAVVSDITPTLKDFIEIDGVRHKIIKDESPPAAGTRVSWKFIVSRGG